MLFKKKRFALFSFTDSNVLLKPIDFKTDSIGKMSILLLIELLLFEIIIILLLFSALRPLAPVCTERFAAIVCGMVFPFAKSLQEEFIRGNWGSFTAHLFFPVIAGFVCLPDLASACLSRLSLSMCRDSKNNFSVQ